MPGSTTVRPRRSVLFMPGSNARAMEKARSLPADAVIFDLEDAVAPDAKEQARAQAIAAVSAGGYGRREVIVRVNASATPWGEADLGAIATPESPRSTACTSTSTTTPASRPPAAKPPTSASTARL